MAHGNPPVLIFGAGLTALGALRSLASAGLPTRSVCEPDELATKSRWYRPAPKLKNRIPIPEELAEYLRCLPFAKVVLLPCSDDWARAIAELPQDLKERYPASIPNGSVMETMTDKWQFAQMLEREGVPHPKTRAVHSWSELSALPDSSFENMFLKPLDSQKFSTQTGAKGFQVKSRESAVQIMTTVERDIGEGFPILLQEYIPGPPANSYLIDGFADRCGQAIALMARRRVRLYPAPFGNTTLSGSIPLSQAQNAIDTVQQILAATSYRGIFSAEFKYDDRDGQFKIIEINARPWWFVEFACRCGMNVCEMSYRDALGLPVSPPSNYRVGRRCCYLVYDYAGHRAAEPGIRGFLRWIRSLQGAEEIVYRSDDPRPGLYLAWRSAQKVLAGAWQGARATTAPESREPVPSWSLEKRKPHS